MERSFRTLCDFIKQNRRPYIYGCGERQLQLARFLRICGVNVAGFVVSEGEHKSACDLPVLSLCELEHVSDALDHGQHAIIMGLSDVYYNEVVGVLHKKGFSNLFFVSEYDKNAIAEKMRGTPLAKDGLHFEIGIAEHCNLNCMMCDHFSQLAEPEFLDVDEFTADMRRISELTGGQLAYMTLSGGEPLLNPRVNEYIEIARTCFPDGRIQLLSNGVLLLKQNTEEWEKRLFETFRNMDAKLVITEYPIDKDYGVIYEKALRYGVEAIRFRSSTISDIKYSVRFPLFTKKIDDSFAPVHCTQFISECIVFKHGKFFLCPTSANIEHLNKRFNLHYEITERDYIDIYKAKSFDEIADFMARPVPFCGYCDVNHRDWYPWATSKRVMDEYITGNEG